MRPRASMISDVAPLVAYCALVFAISSLSAPPSPEYPLEWGDKLSHASAYALMSLLAVRAARLLDEARPLTRRLFPAFIFCIAYGATDEIHQYFVPGRSCDVLDWVADVVGCGAMLLSLRWLVRWRPLAALVGRPLA